MVKELNGLKITKILCHNTGINMNLKGKKK